MSVNDLNEVTRLFQPVKTVSRKVLLEPESVSNHIWFVSSGLLRTFYYQEEKGRKLTGKDNSAILREVTSWIVAEGGFLTDVKSFLYRTPATNYVQTLENCQLYALTFVNYQKIQNTLPILSQSLFEQTIVMADSRIQMSNLRKPEDRYAMFKNLYPGITGRISVNVQASYLNIDPTTLSKLRGKIR